MSSRTTAAILVALAAALVAVLIVVTSGDEGEKGSVAPDTAADTAEPPSDDPATTTGTDPDEPEAPCGVTLAEVQALLPPGSGVTENSTPDPGRCNFTWDDGGPRGIDVASVTGGRDAFDVPAGYEPLNGFGDEAFQSTSGGRASAVAFLGDDLYAADVVADSTNTTDDELRTLCLQLLELALP